MLVGLFIFVTYLPLRFILSLSVFYKFWKGRRYQKRRMVNNKEICKVEMENFLLENKIANIANYDEEWEPFVKRIKESDFNRLDKFETKLV